MKNVILILFITLSFISISANAQMNPTPDVIFDRTNYVGYDISCNGGSAVVNTIVSNGNPPYTYIWYNSDTWIVLDTTEDITLPAGRYTLEIYKGTSYAQYDLELIEPDSLILILDPAIQSGGFNISAYGGHDGHIGSQVQGGNPPYDYLWSNSSNLDFISDLSAGSYSLTITDAGGCTTTQSETLTQPPPLQITSITSPLHNGYNVSCKGCEDGEINMSVIGGTTPYKYTWSNGNMDEDIDTLRARQYRVVVTDYDNTEVTSTITLTEPAELKITLTPQVYQVNSVNYNLSCFDCGNGSITAAITGGVQPYRYLWNTGQTTASISNLSSRDYVLSVIDTNGARLKEAIFLTAPARDDWSMNGNASTTSSQFIGTTDSTDLVIKTNNSVRLKIKNNGEAQFQSTLKINSMSSTGYAMVYVDSTGKLLRDHPSNPPTSCDVLHPAPWYIPSMGPADVTRCTGNVGIGILQPLEKLHIIGTTRWGANSSTTNYLTAQYNGSSRINSFGTQLLINDYTSQNISLCYGGGIVSIGEVTPIGSYRLFVRGGIRTEKVTVDFADHNGWSDYVFDSKYKLRSLADLEAYIKIHKHLPGIPSAIELVESGVDLLEMDSQLLAKIEEQTLYIIDQDKRIIEQDERIIELDKRIKRLEKMNK